MSQQCVGRDYLPTPIVEPGLADGPYEHQIDLARQIVSPKAPIRKGVKFVWQAVSRQLLVPQELDLKVIAEGLNLRLLAIEQRNFSLETRVSSQFTYK